MPKNDIDGQGHDFFDFTRRHGEWNLKEWKGKCHEIVVDFDAEMTSAVIFCGGGARRENDFWYFESFA